MDNRRSYSKNKIIVLELYFLFQHHSISAISYKLGINKQQIERIVDEWEHNENNIIVESKINNK